MLQVEPEADDEGNKENGPRPLVTLLREDIEEAGPENDEIPELADQQQQPCREEATQASIINAAEEVDISEVMSHARKFIIITFTDSRRTAK